MSCSEEVPPTWGAQLRHIGHHDEGPGEVTAVAGLSRLHSLGPQDDLHGARDGAPGQLGLRLLDTDLDTHTRLTWSHSSWFTLSYTDTHTDTHTHLLEVDELGLVCVEVEAGAVVAHRVPADGGRRVLELLGDIFDQRLAVHALEGAAHLQSSTALEYGSGLRQTH